MNERIVFFLSVLVAELGASAIFFLLIPEPPLLRHFPDLLDYLGGHALPALGLWAVIAGISFVLAPRMWRRRQNRSSKIALFVRIGLTGLVIDAIASAVIWLRIDEESGRGEAGSPFASILLRLPIYAVLFAATVWIADLVAESHHRRNPPSMTPPPRFGRN